MHYQNLHFLNFFINWRIINLLENGNVIVRQFTIKALAQIKFQVCLTEFQ